MRTDLNTCRRVFSKEAEKKSSPSVKLAKAIDHQCALGAKNAAHRAECVGGHEVRRGGIPQEGIEDDGIVFLRRLVQEMAAIADDQVEFAGIAIEVVGRHRDNPRIDFNDVHANAFPSELHRNDPDAHSNAEGTIEPRV